ncbi:hypothetical protein [Bacillus sp. ISL-39]|uniref:hypothetical protein n=1 Tax=Bacillus sp. ISL-39 TaxID=2819124 RepID=UPI001BE6D916|nr:hypothetical protein [Bacillus sp. ISL-39]MBT2636664.1 hypothetical protein [Bacillus sp. ISL-39]
MEIKRKLTYLFTLVFMAIAIYLIVESISFKGIFDEFEPVCMLLSLIASHLITTKIIE